MLALKGDSDAVSNGECITSSDAVSVNGKQICAQCCTSSGGCKRRTSNSNNDCIAGMYGGSTFVEMTFAQTVEACSSRGLVLCEKSCSGQGCSYNNGYVWTGLGCDGEPEAEAEAEAEPESEPEAEPENWGR